MAYESSQGIKFKFNNAVYTATSISVAKSRGEINATSTEIPASGGLTRYRPGGLRSIEVKVDWIGKTIPPVDNVYDIVFEGNDPTGGEDMPKAMCTGLSITAQAGEMIRGSATFKVSKD